MDYSISYAWNGNQDAFPTDGENRLADLFWQVYDRVRAGMEMEGMTVEEGERVLVAVQLEALPLGIFALPFTSWEELETITVAAFAAHLTTDWRAALAQLPAEALAPGVQAFLANRQAEVETPTHLPQERWHELWRVALRKAQEALWQAAEQDGDLEVHAPFWNAGAKASRRRKPLRSCWRERAPPCKRRLPSRSRRTHLSSPCATRSRAIRCGSR